MGTIIDVREVIKIYKRGKIEVPALRGINMKVKEGEIVAIVGPSGSGKTTLLTVIGGLEPPTSGKVFVRNIDIWSLTEDELNRFRAETIGFVWQTLT